MVGTNRQGEVNNTIGKGEAKKLTCMTHGHELRWGNAGGRWGAGQRGVKGRKNGTTVIAYSIQYIFLKKK